MKNLKLLVLSILLSTAVYAQTYTSFSYSPKFLGSGIFTGTLSVGQNGGPNPSAAFEVFSNNKGFLMPRLSTLQRNSIRYPSIGLQIYNTTTSAFNYYNGSAWTTIGGASSVTGTAQRIPYFGYDGNLTTDALFYRDSTNNETAIFGQRGDTAVSFYIAPNYGLIAASLETPTDTGSFFVTAETSGISHKSTNGRSSLALFELNGELQQYNTQRDSLNIVGIDSSGFYYENRGADGGTTAKYRFPQDTASVGQVLAVDENDGSGTMQLSWQLPTLTGYTKAQLYLLPNLVAGMRAYCNNAQAPIYGATIIDGGTLKVPVFYDGADWLTY